MPQNPQPVSGADAGTLTDLVNQLSLLLAQILTTERASDDTATIVQLANEYAAVNTLVGQATQAQLATDDALFGQLVSGLKTQSAMLTDMEAKIKSIVTDVAVAGKIVGFIAQAIVLIGRL
jgi:hypothetical protein